APSSLTLGGLINHMAIVEDSWFTDDFAGNPIPEPWASAPWDDDRDWELSTAPDVPTTELFQRYRDAIGRSDAILETVDNLDALSSKLHPDGDAWSMRWILIHLIEETARHCGHADFIRESLDGSVGDFRDEEN
ncbi:MAG: DinB family protein, partial [Actinomycetia bacterium]|nr:DinB family protein [Actinomycetes bacterium]